MTDVSLPAVGDASDDVARMNVDRRRLPPGPRSTVTTAVRYLRDSSGFYARTARKYGDPFSLRTPWGPLVVTGRPEGIETIFTTPPETYGIFAPTVVEPLLGPTALMIASGSEHLRARRILAPRFHGRAVSHYGARMAELTRAQAQIWVPGRPFTAYDAMHAVTLEIILTVFFGATAARKDALREALVAVQRTMGPAIAFLPFTRREFGGIGPWARFQRAMRRLDGIARDLIADARRSPSDDILSMLVSVRDDAGLGYSDAEVRDQLVSLVYAGHETLAGSLAWTLYWIHRTPSVLQRLREELDTAAAASLEAVQSLPYLEAVCNESLRLGPIVPEVTRLLLRPLRLLGYELPAGVTVAPSIALAHSNEATFPDPQEFRPERFLNRKYSAFEFLPFGGGTHRCLGASMAMYEMKVILATLLRSCRFRLVTSGPVRATRRGVLLGPHDGVVIALEERV
jgi:cytochrome P450